ncbi:unnamed protein product [Calicophoron daubneyi]|uniref:Uncharacterized protein n=1 Tax=Calicophoron daubneyi TaxID=300641 RepID=A0AAV2TRW5_CALDB
MPVPTSESFIKRDPITGLGTGAKTSKESPRHRTQSLGRRAYNRTLIAWDADTSVVEPVKSKTKTQKVPARNPIALTGDLGDEVDALRTTSRPRVGVSREPRRDPIAGLGNFGEKEWDPIWKYNGRIRRSKSSSGPRTNPLTGENVKSFDVMLEEKNPGPKNLNRKNDSTRNIFTGENCLSYTVSPELRSPSKKPQRSSSTRNAITGENCTTYDINSEVHTLRKRPVEKACNPLSGENVNTFTVSKEERPRPTKPYVYTNTVTGENLTSYKITPIERNVTPRALKERQNPLSGENVNTYTYRMGEGQRTVKKRDLSSPLTGVGSRGRTYTVSIEEKNVNSDMNGDNSRIRARSTGPSRNVLTGENCQTYFVCQEMRSEKSHPNLLSNGIKNNGGGYNILTGEVK